MYWPAVTAKDNDGEVPDMEVTPGYISPSATSHNFSKGIHDVTFRARDRSGNSESCYFRVEVKGSRCWLFTYVVKLLKLERATLTSAFGLTNTLRDGLRIFLI